MAQWLTSVQLENGNNLDTGKTAGNTVSLRAYDVDGTSYTSFATLTANDTPTLTLSGDVTGVTQSANDNSTKLATTAYVDSQSSDSQNLTWTSSTNNLDISGGNDVTIDQMDILGINGATATATTPLNVTLAIGDNANIGSFQVKPITGGLNLQLGNSASSMDITHYGFSHTTFPNRTVFDTKTPNYDTTPSYFLIKGANVWSSSSTVQKGGLLWLQGGNAAGTANSDGGDVQIDGGIPVNSGVAGDVLLATARGDVIIGDTSDLDFSYGDLYIGTTRMYRTGANNFFINVNGNASYNFNSGSFNNSSGVRWALLDESPSATNPVIITHRDTTHTGMGGTVGSIDLITNSVSRLNLADTVQTFSTVVAGVDPTADTHLITRGWANTEYQDNNVNLTSLAGLTYASNAFVKMTGANTFTLDTSTYLTSALTDSAGTVSGITLTDDGTTVTLGGALSIASDSITMDMLVDIATDTFLGRVTATTGTVEVLTNAQAKTALDLTGTNSGDQTATLIAGAGLSGTTYDPDTSSTFALDFSELADMTADISGTTEFILQNGATESRKTANEIGLEHFDNSVSGFTNNLGTVLGTITDTQVQVGTSTANTIGGSANFTWDDTVVNIIGATNTLLRLDIGTTNSDAAIQFVGTDATPHTWSIGLDESNDDRLKINYNLSGTPVTPSTGTELLNITPAGLFTFNSNVGGGGTANYLRADGTWATPTGSSSLTATHVGYGNGSNELTGDASLTWDVTTHKLDVGKGLSTATAAIQIGQDRSGNGTSYIDLVGDATYVDYGFRILRSNGGANTVSQLVHRGTGDFQFITDEAAPMTFDIDSSEAMRIHSDGNVGIGTSSPNTNLEIGDTDLGVIGGVGLQVGSSTTSSQIRIGQGSTGRAIMSWVYNATIADAYFKIDIPEAQDLILQNSGGNVGIGTTDPLAKVHIHDGSGGNQLEMSRGTGRVLFSMSSDASDLFIYDRTNSAYLLTMKEGGDVGIGTSSPLAKLHIDNNNAFEANTLALMADDRTTFKIQGRNTTLNVLSVNSHNTTDYNMQVVNFAGTAAGDLHIQPFGGNVGIGTTSPSTTLSVINDSITEGFNVKHSNLTQGVAIGWSTITTTGTNADVDLNIIAKGTGDIHLNPTSGNVGIGTTSPTQTLNVSGVTYLETTGSVPDATTGTYYEGLTIKGGNMRLVIDASSTSNAGVYMQTRHESETYPSSYYPLQLNPLGGYIGIGIAAPDSKLHIYDSAASWDSGITLQSGGTLANSDGRIVCDLEGLKYRNMVAGNHHYFRNSANTTHLFIDGTSGEVGIGNIDPAYTLDVTGNFHTTSYQYGSGQHVAAGDGNRVSFWGTGTNYAIWMSTEGNGTYGGSTTYAGTSDYNMYFNMASGTNRGYVFMYNSSPVAQIEGNGTMNAYAYSGTSNVAGTGAAAYFPDGLYSTGDTAWIYSNIITSNHYVNAGTGTGTFGSVTTSGTVTIDSGGTYPINLNDSADRDGLLDISCSATDPTWMGLQITRSDGKHWSLMGSSSQFGLYDDENGEWILTYTENGALQLYHGNQSAAAFTVNQGSITTVNTASSSTSSGGGGLFLSNQDGGTTASGHILGEVAFGGDISGSVWYPARVTVTAAATWSSTVKSTNFNWYVGNGNTTNWWAMRLSSTGQLDVRANIVGNSTLFSDRRLKTDITDITPEKALDVVLATRGINYHDKYGENKERLKASYVAQDIEEILPDMVYESEAPFLEDGEIYKQISPAYMTPYLSEAIKALHKRIESQDKLIEKLMNKLNE